MLIGFREIGQGLASMEMFCRCLNMAQPLTRVAYNNIVQDLRGIYVEFALKGMQNAAKEVIQCNGGELYGPKNFKSLLMELGSTVDTLHLMHLSSAFPGRGTLRLPGGNQLKLKKSAPQYPSLSGLLGLFLARGLGTYRWLPLSLIVSLPF